MRYYLNICKIEKDELICLEADCCRRTFWDKEIEITEKFFTELSRHREAMLIPEMDKKDNLILDFAIYFDRTIEFSVVENKFSPDRTILICKLDAYFVPNSTEDDPF